MFAPLVLGTIPQFLNLQKMGLYDTHTGLILIYTAYSLPFSVLIMRNTFETLPSDFQEAAMIDGAGHAQTFFKIMLPLSTPALGTIAISAFVGAWNAYYAPMMYFDYGKATTLSLFLQRLMNSIEMLKSNPGFDTALLDQIPGTGLTMAVACITVLPMVFVFPWFQKYFVKGMAIGAVKA